MRRTTGRLICFTLLLVLSSSVLALSLQETLEFMDLDSTTEMPSMSPTRAGGGFDLIIWSSNPSATPSEMPSPSPSAFPTKLPSAMPSARPSPSPSELPTSVPSVSPSNFPTRMPSFEPTNAPTITPRPTMSFEPSFVPTVSLQPTLSMYPSNAPSLYPSNVPSSMPSQRPSTVPSMNPSMVPSTSPSMSPSLSHRPSQSAVPSTEPSSFPSAMPSQLPTLSSAPSQFPSTDPSTMPTPTPTTSVPSQTPSYGPSNLPTDIPSSKPSPAPSSMPSSSPTLTCHDKASYRNPINGMTCSRHAGTDCYKWHNIGEFGLNTTQLGDLINNCPETCQIPCGDFVDFSIPVSYRLTEIPGLMDDSSRASLETASFHYILPYVKEAAGDHIFELDAVVLSSQSLDTPERKLRQQTRAVSESGRDAMLLVTVIFEGFSIGLQLNETSDLLVSGMNSTGFTRALQASDDFFKTAVISSAESVDYRDHDPPEDERNGPLSATVLVVILVLIGLVVAMSFTFLHRGKVRTLISRGKSKENPNNTDSDSMPSFQRGRPRFISIDMTRGPVPDSYVRRFIDMVVEKLKATRGSNRSLAYPATHIQKLEYQSSHQSQQGSPVNVASLSFDRTNTVPTPSVPATNLNGLRPLSPQPKEKVGSGISEDANEKTLGPLDTFSPMSEDTEESNRVDDPFSNLFPSMIVVDDIDDTSSKARRTKRKDKLVPEKDSPLKGSSLPPMLLSYSALDAWYHHDDIPHAMSPLGIIVDSESEDDTSFSSAPSSSGGDRSESILTLSRSMSSTALDSLNGVESPMNLLTFQSSSSSSEDDLLGQNDCRDVPIELVSKEPKSQQVPVSPMEDSSGHERVGILNSFLARSPTSTMKMTPKSSRKTPSGKKSLLTRRSSTGTTHGNSTTVCDSEELGNRLIFEAPRTGQLGLVLEVKNNSDPIIHAVKDYSPLFGKVEIGDSILEIDGKSQKGATLSEVMQLLASKSGRRMSNGQSIRIIVNRQPKRATNRRSVSEGGTNQGLVLRAID